MFWFILIEFILLILFTIYLVNEYSARFVRFYVKFLVFITYLTCFSVVALLPLDIYYVLIYKFTFKRH